MNIKENIGPKLTWKIKKGNEYQLHITRILDNHYVREPKYL
jgi:hypothetical protein